MLWKVILLILSIVLGLRTIFPSFLDKLHKLFKDYLKYRDLVKEEKKQQRIEEKQKELKEAIDNGDLSDLINTTKELGRETKK